MVGGIIFVFPSTKFFMIPYGRGYFPSFGDGFHSAAGQAYRVSFAIKTAGEMKYRAGCGAAEADPFGKPQRYPRAAGAHIGLGVTQTCYAECDVIGWLPKEVDSKARRLKIFMPVLLCQGRAAIAACGQGTTGRRAETAAVPAPPAVSYVL